MSLNTLRQLSKGLFSTKIVIVPPSCCNFCKTSARLYSSTRATHRVENVYSSQIISSELLSVPNIHFQPQRNAGHSKWANIRHVKAANDQARSKEIIKFFNFVKVAVKEGGGAELKSNGKLAQVVAQYKEAKLPMATLERLLQNLQAKKGSQHCIHPIRGPGNSIMLVDLESPNLNKSKQELNTILRKNKGVILDESILFMFDHKGLLYCNEVEGKPAASELLDDATMHAIEAGANDVTFLENYEDVGATFEFLTEPSAFLRVKGALEKFKYSLAHAEVSYIPKNYVELSDEEIDAANKLYNKLTEHPDVVKVFVNIA